MLGALEGNRLTFCAKVVQNDLENGREKTRAESTAAFNAQIYMEYAMDRMILSESPCIFVRVGVGV